MKIDPISLVLGAVAGISYIIFVQGGKLVKP